MTSRDTVIADFEPESGIPNRVALDVAMRNLKEYMSDKDVRFNDENYEDVYFSLVDLLVKECDMTYDAARNCICRHQNLKMAVNPQKQVFLDEQTYEFNSIVKSTKFCRLDGVHYFSHGVTLEGFYRIMLLLPGSHVKAFRDINHDLYIRHNAGDETLDLERLANAQSTTDPIKIALRQRLIARKYAAAASPPAEPAPKSVEETGLSSDGPPQHVDHVRMRDKQREQRLMRERADVLDRQREQREERRREKLEQIKRKREERDRFEFEHPALLDRVVSLERTNADLARTNTDLQRTNADFKRANEILWQAVTQLMNTNNDLTQRITLLENSLNQPA
jgi:hypothetical protein